MNDCSKALPVLNYVGVLGAGGAEQAKGAEPTSKEDNSRTSQSWVGVKGRETMRKRLNDSQMAVTRFDFWLWICT